MPVRNLIGPAGWTGSGLSRLMWRDLRSDEQLQEIGIHAHPTPNAIHRGECDIVVQQGNHFTSMPSNGQPDPAVSMEVLHLPWRSWTQFERKVVNAGRGYEASPDLKPSPNHHGMADYRRWKDGTLEESYLIRSPGLTELRQGEQAGYYVRDPWLWDTLRGLAAGPALRPALLQQVLGSDGLSEAPREIAGSALGRHLEENTPTRPGSVREAALAASVEGDLE